MARLLCAPTAGLAGIWGGVSNSSLPVPRMSLRVEDYSLIPPILCPPTARFSALHHAALGGSLELIALLLEAQATVDIKDSNGESSV